MLWVTNPNYSLAQNKNSSNSKVDSFPALVPFPTTIQMMEGTFTFQKEATKIYFSNTPEVEKLVALVTPYLSETGTKFSLQPWNNKTPIPLKEIQTPHLEVWLNTSKPTDALNPEAYTLSIKKNTIKIEAAEAQGLFYGLQSLRQLIRTNFGKSYPIKLQALDIADSPRFTWRGMHLDVSRHFFSVAEVKTYIDYLAMYKFNKFHWHLTDDQGWRIEIKKYPKLTEVGSVRYGTRIGYGSKKPELFDTITYGGFYTQEQIKDIVKYASDRFISVIPEIDVPGHSQALIYAYPEYGCQKPDGVWRDWGISPSILNVKPETFDFLKDVFTELATLFPSEYIHIGGDEALKKQWKASAEVQAKKNALGLKTEEELQSWFIGQLNNIVKGLGKTLVGWDEIAEGGLNKDALLMSWRGVKQGKEAAEAGNKVVMCPFKWLYLDAYQWDKKQEPLCIGNMIPLQKCYEFEPVADDIRADARQNIIGLQANVWTEYIRDFSRVQEQIFPRMLAVAETSWTPIKTKNYNRFRQNAEAELNWLRLNGIRVGYMPAK